jgi:hypothetical protein
MAGKAMCTRKSRLDSSENGVITKKKPIIISSNNLNNVEETTMDHGKKHRGAPIIAIIALFAVSAFCAPDSSGMQARILGKGSFEFGQIVDGQYRQATDVNQTLSHYALEDAKIQVGGEIKRNDGLSIITVAEGIISFPYALPTDGASTGGFQCYSPRYTWDFIQADAEYAFGDRDEPYLNISAGYFPFKYNPDARNFGDYLFRINPYPQFLQTNFDMPYQRLLGLHLGSTLFSSLKQDLLLTSETELWPLKDFSLSYVVSYNLFKFAEFGAGIMWDRLLAVDNKITNPPTPTNPNNFSFQGTKVEFRGALDIKQFFPFRDVFGKNDLRLYGELCLNGLKNYPIIDTTNALYPGYNDLAKRMPILIGFNVPVFRLLDVLSIEAEWWDNSYQRDGNTYYFANSYWAVFNKGNALTATPTVYGLPTRTEPYGGAWHWSVYAKKAILSNLNLVAQVARDHTFLQTSQTGPSNGDPQEAVDGRGNWTWLCKIEYGF